MNVARHPVHYNATNITSDEFFGKLFRSISTFRQSLSGQTPKEQLGLEDLWFWFLSQKNMKNGSMVTDTNKNYLKIRLAQEG